MRNLALPVRKGRRTKSEKKRKNEERVTTYKPLGPGKHTS